MEKNPQHLFVYSSLRSGFQHPAYQYISKHFQLVSDASVKGLLFDLGNNIVGVPTDDDLFIKGELYIVKDPGEFSWAIAQLDDYEGVGDHEEGAPLYRRALTSVYTGQQEEKAWVYWYTQPIKEAHFIESGDILAYLQEKK